ncbi:MAG: PRC-barrel domain-containing protein [Yoonia sp.]|uniref:PRC-barrel domain-containing protein n=1 Tax=Yoonia sp. TaxID=2212373 RepID=UPI003EF6BDEF
MKTFLTTTATALVLGTSAYADAHTGAFSDLMFDSAVNLNASDVIGMRVYATEAEIEGDTVTIDGQTQWDDIGEINEIVLTRDGNAQTVIIGVGGFLGIGEKDVAVAMDQLQFVTEEGEIDAYFIVINASTIGIQDAPAYEHTQMADTTTPENQSVLEQPMKEDNGYTAVSVDTLTTQDLMDARVYGTNDADIGEISEILLTDDGKLDRAIIDVGGFLGIGEKPVAIAVSELQILREDGGDDVRVYIDATQDALEVLPAYDG